VPFVEVQLGTKTIKLHVTERPFLVEATAANVEALVIHCRSAIAASTARGEPPRLKKRLSGASSKETLNGETGAATDALAPRTFAMPTNPTPALVGKVTWHPSKGGWAVHYKPEHGNVVIKRITVKTPGADVTDKKEAFELAKSETYREAIRFWNTADKSKRERIPEPK
jgi:hypothetical protein